MDDFCRGAVFIIDVGCPSGDFWTVKKHVINVCFVVPYLIIRAAWIVKALASQGASPFVFLGFYGLMIGFLLGLFSLAFNDGS